jgi:methylated-DNA-protein-cysteine methyltransferase-like protein
MTPINTKPDFFELVFQVVRLIPRGRVTSYGAIARYLGTGGSARTVGWAMNQSHSAQYDVPAHRVVNRNGMLTGKHHFSSPDEKMTAFKISRTIIGTLRKNFNFN